MNSHAGCRVSGDSRRYAFQRHFVITHLTYCRFVALAAIAIGITTNNARAGIPALATGVRIQEGSSAITVDSGNSAPEAVDWNNDGKIDLLVGQHNYGAIRLYINQGTSNTPFLNGYSFIQSGGSNINVDYG